MKKTVIATLSIAALILAGCNGSDNGTVIPDAPVTGDPVGSDPGDNEPAAEQIGTMTTTQVDGQTVDTYAAHPVMNFSATVTDSGFSATPSAAQAFAPAGVSVAVQGNPEDEGGSVVVTDPRIPGGSLTFSNFGSYTEANRSILESETATLADGSVATGDTGFEVKGALDYSAFGGWRLEVSDGNYLVGQLAAGEPTTDLPTSGTASYSGTTAGTAIGVGEGGPQPTYGDMSADVDFGARSVGFATSNTVMGSGVDDTNELVAAPTLDISGTLAFEGANGFAGSVSTAGGMTGTAAGQFYGPQAAEMAGVYQASAGDAHLFGGFVAGKDAAP